MIGRRVGRYRVLAALGHGGMSSVWRAHDELLDRDVALKLLADELAGSAQARRRFRHEAQVAASLDYPAVAAVYDSGEADGVTFIAMALIDGETLAERIERSLVPVDDALRVAIAVAGALAHAHAHGVVHRDVTSRNIMLARDGRVLVLDFGLALAAGVSRVSSSRTLVGTAAYMAPEVLQGGDADARSDLYGLGVVLYEMLTGRVPFRGDRPETLTYAALHQEAAPPSHRRAEVTPDLDRLVLRMLAREPGERHPSAEILLADLNAVRVGPTASIPAPEALAAGSLPGTRSVAADLLANGPGPLYLALLPLEGSGDAGSEALATRLAGELSEALSTSLAHLGKLHLVAVAGGPAAGEDPGAFTRRAGAHALLIGTLRVSGAHARVTWRVVDADRGAQIAAGSVRGAAADTMHLEDELVADVRKGLGLRVEEGGFDSRVATRVPAAAERFDQATRYLTRGDNEASIDGAIAILERLIAATPDDAALQATMARACLAKFVLTRQHVWEGRAAACVERARTLAPAAPETILALGELRLGTGSWSEALSAFETVLATRDDVFEARLGKAWALSGLGRADDAETYCRRTIETRPDDWRGHHVLGKVLLARGDYTRAVEPWRRALQLSADNAWVSSNLGTALFRSNRIADAVVAFQHSVDIQPTAVALSNLGTALFYEGRYQEAAAAFESATELTPADPLVWGNLGNARRLSPGLEAGAAEALERAVGLMRERLSSSNEGQDVWSRMAGWYAGLGRRTEAMDACDRALAAGPPSPAVLAELGHVALQLGDRDLALRRLAEAVRHGYGVDLLRRSPDLTVLREDPRFREILASRPGSQGADPGAASVIGG